MCFSRTRLSIGKNSCVKSMETSQNKISCTRIKDILLTIICPKHPIKIETLGSKLQLFPCNPALGFLYTLFPISLGELSADQGSHSDSHRHRTRILTFSEFKIYLHCQLNLQKTHQGSRLLEPQHQFFLGLKNIINNGALTLLHIAFR